MVMLLLMAVYLMGYVFSYMCYRSMIRTKFNRNWLLLEKIIAIALSLFSWAGLITFGLIIITGLTFRIDLDKQCKW
jgi:hypothetical protein